MESRKRWCRAAIKCTMCGIIERVERSKKKAIRQTKERMEWFDKIHGTKKERIKKMNEKHRDELSWSVRQKIS